ncbi:MAG: DUF6171 family protein [Treponema sp.]|nr:DUF6171 family protein [Treponema sp.]
MPDERHQRFCPECEIRELQSQVTKERIENDIANMVYVPGVTAPEYIYKKRLEACKACNSLQAEIMCSECGSYVAYRARMLSATCPYPGKDKWLLSQRNEK